MDSNRSANTCRCYVQVGRCSQGRIFSWKIIQSLVGREIGDGVTTLDALPIADQKNTLVKIDVEGAEIAVVEGARTWMDPSNLFLIEVHEKRFLDQLKNMFAERGHRLVQIDQRPLFLLGREMRDRNNWWLVSDLGESC